MNFKNPRCKDTPDGFVSARKPKSGELCGVGNGECSKIAIDVADGGGAGEMPVCEGHKREFIALSKLLNEMTPNQLMDFEKAVTKAEEK